MAAAFDSVDHDILLQRLQMSYGLGGVELINVCVDVCSWLREYDRLAQVVL